ncbi:MAG: integrase arm-type DNA-binding domain-containing protein [Gammaproteobacteria bacterium]|nr:integrase arm-type DNA-binding domain-containing protein [Gammaproteobacteria bacterium]
MEKHTEKRTAKQRLTLTKRAVEALLPNEKPFIAWDDKLTGFGVRVQPSGIKSFILNYRTGDGGRRASNKRIVIGRYGRVSPDKARRLAQELVGRVAGGSDPADDRSKARRVPTLTEAFEDYMKANPHRAPKTVINYRHNLRNGLSDWLARPLDAIARRDVEERFHRITEKHGWATANQTLSMLRSVYRRPCVDHDGLRNPVDLWLVGGGRFHRPRRRRISAPAEVLPRWRAGLEATDMAPIFRDLFLFGFYTGMRKGEVLALRWERVDLAERILRVEETKTGNPLELPVTRQLAVILERRWLARECAPEGIRCWVFPSAVSVSGHLEDLHRYYDEIGDAGGTRFWFHGLRNCFITVAERELMLPRSLTKRLVNHARSSDVTEGYAADWTVEQLREPAQRIADRIDELMDLPAPAHGGAR